MNKILPFFILLTSYPLSQGFDPNTGKVKNQTFDPKTGEIIADSIYASPNLKIFQLSSEKPKDNVTLSDFEDIYNTETLYPSPPWYGQSISSKYYKAKKGPYILSTSDIELEMSKYPQSQDILNDYIKWKRLSFISLGVAIVGPLFFSSVEVGLLPIVSFYGGIGLSIYCTSKFTKKWYKAIWTYNRENIKSQLSTFDN